MSHRQIKSVQTLTKGRNLKLSLKYVIQFNYFL